MRYTPRRITAGVRRRAARAALRAHRALADAPAVPLASGVKKPVKKPVKKAAKKPARATAPRPPVGQPPLPLAAEIYRGLDAHSLTLAALRTGAVPPVVSLAVPPVDPDKIFAGVATALQASRLLALELDRPLRIVPFGPTQPAKLQEAVHRFLAADDLPVPAITVVPEALIAHTTVSADDVWVVTYWTTAHAAQVACQVGRLDPRQVVYLVQDYEPGFKPWSVEHALIRQTYHAGFHHVVNSASLASYLDDREGCGIDPQLVFAPHLELDRLAAAARRRESGGAVRVFFYARPGKPRNLYALGVAALRAAAAELATDGVDWEVVTAGEAHPDIELAGGVVARSLGTLSWDGYFDLLSSVDVGLTLMHSPHPSHPPLEVAVSGGVAITNELDGARSGFHERITAVPADPRHLAAALAQAVREAAGRPSYDFAPPPDGSLGLPLSDVVTSIASRLTQGAGRDEL